MRIAVAGGPRQQVLRPAELEDAELRRDLMREGTYGDCAVLDPAQGTSVNLEGSSLAISQDSRSVVLDELGEVAVTLPACVPDPGGFASLPVLIEEDVAHAVQQGLRFCDWVLDRVDPLRRMSDVAVVATIAGGGHIGWRTREEQSANPNSYSVSPTHERIPVHLEPPLRKRAALTHDLARMVEDFTILLRRQCR